eukprot:7383072-Prymnesium_polylepis.1
MSVCACRGRLGSIAQTAAHTPLGPPTVGLLTKRTKESTDASEGRRQQGDILADQDRQVQGSSRCIRTFNIILMLRGLKSKEEQSRLGPECCIRALSVFPVARSLHSALPLPCSSCS